MAKDDFFDIADLIGDEVTLPAGMTQLERKEPREKKNLPCKVEQKDLADIKKVEADADYARNNLYEATEAAMGAISDLTDLIQRSGNPVMYVESLSELIGKVSQMQKDLLDIHKKKKEINKEAAPTAQTPSLNGATINNAVFVGSTKELQDVIAKMNTPKE